MKKEIECLARIQELVAGIDQMMTFLIEEKVVDMQQVKAVQSSPMPNKEFRVLLNAVRDKLQLLEFEWQLLPVERIKITIVTERNSREFAYNF